MEDAMIQELVQDFAEQAEELYESIQDALVELKEGDAEAGILELLGPVHTLKGTAGFIQGFEPLAHYVHQVEDYLNLQKTSGSQISSQVRELALESIEKIFEVIESAKDGDPVDVAALDQRAAKLLDSPPDDEVSAGQEEAAKLQPGLDSEQKEALPAEYKFQSLHADFSVELQQGFAVITGLVSRVHKAEHFDFMRNIFSEIDGQSPVVFNFQNISTLGSHGWGILSQYAQKYSLAFISIAEQSACERTFLTFGMNQYIKQYPSISDIPNP